MRSPHCSFSGATLAIRSSHSPHGAACPREPPRQGTIAPMRRQIFSHAAREPSTTCACGKPTVDALTPNPSRIRLQPANFCTLSVSAPARLDSDQHSAAAGARARITTSSAMRMGRGRLDFELLAASRSILPMISPPTMRPCPDARHWSDNRLTTPRALSKPRADFGRGEHFRRSLTRKKREPQKFSGCGREGIRRHGASRTGEYFEAFRRHSRR